MDQHFNSVSDFQAFLKLSQLDTRFRTPTPVEAHDAAFTLHGKKTPDFHQLFQNSRNFALTYHALQIGLLFAFTAFHWGRRLQSWRSSRMKRTRAWNDSRAGSDDDLLLHRSNGTETITTYDRFRGGIVTSEASSSSSTLRDIPASPVKTWAPNFEPEEQTPLLSGTQDQHSIQTPRSQVIRRKIKAWLVYQPKPVPFFNKTLPSNGLSLAVVAMIGIQIFYIFYDVHLSVRTLFLFADRTSLLFVANLPLLYLLAAKNQPLSLLTGHSYESMNIFHRRLGEVMCLLALLHAVSFLAVWYTIFRPTGFALAQFLLSKIILWGMGAFLAYELLYLTSLGSFRQRRYELFLGLHVILQVFALLFLWFHHKRSRPYVYATLVIFLLDRFFYRMGFKNRTVQGTLEVKEDQATVVLRARLSKLTGKRRGRWNRLLGPDILHGWKATEHVFVTVPSISPKHIFQAHPFTIASKAPAIGETEFDLELIIRSQDGFSQDLLHHARIHNNNHTVAIRLDGPYGSQSAVHLLQESDISIIVAGGSGIAVAWPAVWATLDAAGRGSDANVDLEDKLPAISHNQFSKSWKKILFIWIVHDSSHLSWLGSKKLDALQSVQGVDVVVPPPTGHNGHPDVGHIITTWLHYMALAGNANPTGSRRQGAGRKVGIMCSGPDGLNRSIRNLCSSLLSQGQLDVSVEIEKFGW